MQPVINREQALAFELGVESVGSGVLLQRRQKVFGDHHGGAAGIGGGLAPIAARGLYMDKAGGLHAPLRYQPLGMLHVFLRPVGARAAWRHSISRSIRICRCFALPWQTTVCGFAPNLVLIWKWNQALQKRGVV